jgi:hypothetical protein
MAPLDLANLSYTNKLFWETLTGPAAVSMWKVARRPYKAPDPPKDFSEPRWAILLFGTLCQVRFNPFFVAESVLNLVIDLRRQLPASNRLAPPETVLPGVREA